jgi:hypothetical protein
MRPAIRRLAVSVSAVSAAAFVVGWIQGAGVNF